jgi:integrase/recombinase XerC
LNGGAEISRVQKIMGHSSLASTQVYTSANIEELKKAYNNAHPRMTKTDKKQ